MTDFKKGDKAIIINNGDFKSDEPPWIQHCYHIGQIVEILERWPEKEPKKYYCISQGLKQMVWGEHLAGVE